VEFGHETEPFFWGHHQLDGRGCFPKDLDFFLQVMDTSLCCRELSRLSTVPGQA
jgi:hypothetical protein